ncbi:MAG: hypothetical protein ACRYF2_04975 [Janthinobacterium lividum]
MGHDLSRAFTAREDRVLLDGRAAGLSWDVIGSQIGTTGKACHYRLTRGLQVPDPKPVQVGRTKARSDYDTPDEDPKRLALPPGADATWQAITANTVLDGSAYR